MVLQLMQYERVSLKKWKENGDGTEKREERKELIEGGNASGREEEEEGRGWAI